MRNRLGCIPWRRILPLALLSGMVLLAVRAFPEQSAGSAPVPNAKPPAGVFHPTKEQWSALKVAEVQELPFQNVISTDGSIAFDDEKLTPVFSPYSGRVTKVFAKLGDAVKKGAPLMAVDAAEFVQGQNDLVAARAALDLARATEKRQQGLYEAGAAALKDWRQSQADLATAQAAYAAARGRLRVLGRTDAEIDRLENGPGGAEAVLTAPIAGTITQRQVGVGQYVASVTAGGGAPPLFAIGDLSTVWLIGNVRESDAPALAVGQTAEIGVLALPGKTFQGRVDWVGAALDATTHRLPVRVAVANREGLLKPMMFASFSIAAGEPKPAPAVPQGAVVYDGEKARVFVVGENQGIAAREIRVGRRRGDMLEVVDGLRAGEKVVTAGTLFVDRAAAGD